MFKLWSREKQNDKPLTICANCKNCYIDDTAPLPKYLCTKFPLEMKTDVVRGHQYYVEKIGSRELYTLRPYKYCFLINDGNCPYFEAKEEIA